MEILNIQRSRREFIRTENISYYVILSNFFVNLFFAPMLRLIAYHQLIIFDIFMMLVFIGIIVFFWNKRELKIINIDYHIRPIKTWLNKTTYYNILVDTQKIISIHDFKDYENAVSQIKKELMDTYNCNILNFPEINFDRNKLLCKLSVVFYEEEEAALFVLQH